MPGALSAASIRPLPVALTVASRSGANPAVLDAGQGQYRAMRSAEDWLRGGQPFGSYAGSAKRLSVRSCSITTDRPSQREAGGESTASHHHPAPMSGQPTRSEMTVSRHLLSGLLIGYAGYPTDEQDLTAQRDALAGLGVEPERISTSTPLKSARSRRSAVETGALAVGRRWVLDAMVRVEILTRWRSVEIWRLPRLGRSKDV
jgi:hypothetical protein